jgi:hypothetical protein
MPTPDAPTLATLLENAKPEMLEQPERELKTPWVGRERAVELGLTVCREFSALGDLPEQTLLPQVVAAVRAAHGRVSDRAYVFYAADLHAESPWVSADDTRQAQLSALCRSHDDLLFGFLWAMYRNQPEVSAELTAIRKGSGRRDDAEDVLREVELFRTHWAELQGKCPVTTESLAEAEAHANEAIRLLDRGVGSAKGSPRDLKRRAYTLWERDYMHVVRTGRYLAGSDPAAERRFPGIHSAAAPAKAKAPTEPTAG